MYVQISNIFPISSASFGIPELGNSLSTACIGVGRRALLLSGIGVAATKAENERVAMIVESFMLGCLGIFETGVVDFHVRIYIICSIH
jgi:hypothetical protein